MAGVSSTADGAATTGAVAGMHAHMPSFAHAHAYPCSSMPTHNAIHLCSSPFVCWSPFVPSCLCPLGCACPTCLVVLVWLSLALIFSLMFAWVC